MLPLPDLDAAVRTVETLVERFSGGGPGRGHPGVAWGLVADGALAASGGAGAVRVRPDGTPAGPVPDADSVFRIASMTKSFTATAVLALRDDGRLGLDEPVTAHVPELADVRLPTADSPVLTVRHLLTMSGGLPTDDPWGDRQQELGADDVRRVPADRAVLRVDARARPSSTPTWGTRSSAGSWPPRPARSTRTSSGASSSTRSDSPPPSTGPRTSTGTGSRPATGPPRGCRRCGRRPDPSTGTEASGAGRSCRSIRTGRSRRWAACSHRSATWRAGWPASPAPSPRATSRTPGTR